MKVHHHHNVILSNSNNNHSNKQEEQEELPLAYHTNICVYIYIHITYIIGTYFPLIKVRWFTNNEKTKKKETNYKTHDAFTRYETWYLWNILNSVAGDISLDANTYIVHKCTDVQIYQEYYIWWYMVYIFIRFPELIVLQSEYTEEDEHLNA